LGLNGENLKTERRQRRMTGDDKAKEKGTRRRVALQEN
jgi:hypothetical protein